MARSSKAYSDTAVNALNYLYLLFASSLTSINQQVALIPWPHTNLICATAMASVGAHEVPPYYNHHLKLPHL